MLKWLADLQIPILTKITIPYIVLAIVIALGGTYIITEVVIDSVEERFTNQLIETGLLANDGVVRTEQNLLEALRLISHTQGIDEAVAETRVGTLNQLVLPLAYNAELESVIIISRRGLPLLALRFNENRQLYENSAINSDLDEQEFVAAVLEGRVDESGDKFAGVVDTETGEFFYVSGPILNSSGNVQGVLLVGESVSSLAQKLRRETLAQITFYSLSGERLSSTLMDEGEDLEQDVVDQIVSSQEESSLTRPIVDSGISYNELLTTWDVRDGEDVGVMGLALPTSFLAQTSEVTRTTIFLLMSLALFMVIVVGMYIASRITRPILDLRDAAMRVSEGDLGVKLNKIGRDEVGVLTNSFNEMVDSLSKSQKDLLDAYDKTIEGWARALDLRDHETEDHSRRVADLSYRLAQQMGMNGERLENLRRGALLHDIGKIGIPDSILLKKGKLSESEIGIMHQHPVFGKEFMEQIEYLQTALHIPYSHHEKWDGSGYPQGLSGEEIPLEARIFAIIDVWDALTSDRPYRKAMSPNDAIEIIYSDSGKHFDPEVVNNFLKFIREEIKEKEAEVNWPHDEYFY